MILRIRLSVLLLLLLSFPGAAFGVDLHVVTEEWPPYNFTQNGEIVGCSTAIVRAILDASGLEYEIRSYPWARAYAIAQHDPDTLIFTIGRNAERENNFYWIGPIGERKLSLFALHGRKDISIDSLQDVRKYTLGLVRQDVSHQFFVEQGFSEGGDYSLAATPDQTLQMLLAGRVDLVATTGPGLALLLAGHDLAPETVSQVYEVSGDPYYMALSLTTTSEKRAAVETAMAALAAEGTIQNLNQRCLEEWISQIRMPPAQWPIHQWIKEHPLGR